MNDSNYIKASERLDQTDRQIAMYRSHAVADRFAHELADELWELVKAVRPTASGNVALCIERADTLLSRFERVMGNE